MHRWAVLVAATTRISGGGRGMMGTPPSAPGLSSNLQQASLEPQSKSPSGNPTALQTRGTRPPPEMGAAFYSIHTFLECRLRDRPGKFSKVTFPFYIAMFISYIPLLVLCWPSALCSMEDAQTHYTPWFARAVALVFACCARVSTSYCIALVVGSPRFRRGEPPIEDALSSSVAYVVDGL